MDNNQSYGKRMWSIWSPLIIKFGISMAVYMTAMSVFMGRYMLEHSRGGRFLTMADIVNDSQRSQDMMNAVTEWTLDFAVPLEGIAALVTIPIFLFLIYRDRKKEQRQGITIIRKKAELWRYPAVIGISAAMCLGLNNLIFLMDLSSHSEAYEETIEVFYQPPFAMQIVCLGILMPICEELAYRGLMFRRIRAQAKFVYAAAYSSIVFAITHGNMVQSLYGFLMGMMLSYTYEKYGSSAAPIIGHVAANIISVAGTQYRWFDWMMDDIMRIGIVTVVCAAFASTIYVFMQRMESSFSEVKIVTKDNEQNGNLM